MLIARYLVRGTAQSVLPFTSGRPVHLNTNSTSPGSIQRHRSYCAKTIHLHISIYPPLYIAVYSFIWLTELKQRGVNEINQASKRQEEDDS